MVHWPIQYGTLTIPIWYTDQSNTTLIPWRQILYFAVSHFTVEHLQTVHCTMYTVQCTLYNVHCTMYTVQCTLYNVHCTMYTVQCTLYNVHCTMYTVQCTLYNVHCTMYIVQYRDVLRRLHMRQYKKCLYAMRGPGYGSTITPRYSPLANVLLNELYWTGAWRHRLHLS